MALERKWRHQVGVTLISFKLIILGEIHLQSSVDKILENIVIFFWLLFKVSFFFLLFSQYSARRLIGSRIIESAAYSNQILMAPLYFNSTQNTSVNW